MRPLLLITILVLITFPSLSHADPFRWTGCFSTPDGMPRAPKSFSAAKRIALRTIYQGHRTTFYCRCGYTPRKQVSPSRCGYKPRRANARSKRIEWEHIVPAAAFGKHRPCWKRRDCTSKRGRKIRGRKCCRATDPIFRRMEADLVNLVPAIGELNGDRSNYRFDDIPGEPRVYGRCDFEVDRKRRIAEPPPGRQGEIARTYLYMHYAYKGGLPLSKNQIRRFLRWHRADPPDAWEKERNRRISKVQGGENPLIE
ncbi:endonuclease [Myxococcota bacterium]